MMVMTRKPTKIKDSSPNVEESTQAAAQNKKETTTGRPSKYTPELAKEICEKLSEGIPLREICREEHMPAWRTIYDWMGRSEDLSAAIARARDVGYDKMAEECLEIADTPVMGHKQVMSDKATYTTVEDMLGHRRLQIETRLKLLAKFHPTKYGEKAAKAEQEGPTQAQEDAKAVLREVLKNIELKRQNAAG